MSETQEVKTRKPRKPSKKYLVYRCAEGVSIDDVEILTVSTKAEEVMTLLAENEGAVFKVFE